MWWPIGIQDCHILRAAVSQISIKGKNISLLWMPNKGNTAANELLEKLFAARALAAYKGLYIQSALLKRMTEVVWAVERSNEEIDFKRLAAPIAVMQLSNVST